MHDDDETLFAFYNTIDGDADEKAYNSDLLVQRYFQRRKTSEIKELLQVKDADVLLDIGCGSGVQMRELGGRMVGVDVSRNAVRFARNKNLPGAEFIVGDAQHLPIKAGVIDKIVCAEIIEHLTRPQNLIAEISRVLKPGGSVVVTTPNNNPVWQVYEYCWDRFGRGRKYGETHVSLFTVRRLQDAFSGFMKCKTKTIFFVAPALAVSNNCTLLNIGKQIDRLFERWGWGVSIIHYAEKSDV